MPDRNLDFTVVKIVKTVRRNKEAALFPITKWQVIGEGPDGQRFIMPFDEEPKDYVIGMEFVVIIRNPQTTLVTPTQ